MKKYIQLYNNIKEAITAGRFLSGTQLPTEGELSAKYDVSRQTVRQALQLLREDGYVYSQRGSGTYVLPANERVRNNRRIAVVVTYFSEYIFPSILRGIAETAQENGYVIELNATNNSISQEKEILSKLSQDTISGIIVEGTKSALPNPNTCYYKRLADCGVPIVFINSIYPGLEQQNVVSVLADDYAGGYLLAQRLLAMGHTHIGCISKSDDCQGIRRFAGVIAALSASGADFDDQNFVWFTTETKHSFLKGIPSGVPSKSCTALICYNDEVVETIAPELRRTFANVQALFSFDRNLNAGIIPAGITYYSLQHPKEQLGRIACSKLLELLAGKQTSSVVLSWQED